MPQRQFWTMQHPCRIKWELHESPVDPEKDPTVTLTIFDQEAKAMVRTSATLPVGFTEFAIPDVVKQSMEAYSSATPEDARLAFLRCAAAWRTDVRQLGLDRL